MRKALFFACLVSLTLSSCGTDSTSFRHSPLVFFINLAPLPMDISLGDPQNPIYLAQGLGAEKTLPLISFKEDTVITLSYRTHLRINWETWSDEEKRPYKIKLLKGRTYAILINSQSQGAILALGEKYTSEAKIAFLNDTPYKIEQIQVGEELGAQVRAYVQEMESGRLTEFYSMRNRSSSIFWKLTDCQPYPDFQELQDEQKNRVRIPFEPGHNYLFIASFDRFEAKSSGKLFDITPQ